jgi:uncharacterized RDD family membrane protein YckC
MNKMTLSKRIGSMLLDHLIMTIVIAIFAIPLLIINFFLQRYFDFRLTWPIGILIFIVYFNKDFFRAKSPAKRIIGLQVVDNSTGEIASRLKCFIRNLTCILWPLEIFVTLFSKQRRIGDLIANTKVVTADKEPVEHLIKEIKNVAQHRL